MPSRHFRDTEEYRHLDPSFPEIDDSRSEHFTDEGGPRQRHRGRLFVVVDGNGDVASEAMSERKAHEEVRQLSQYYDTVHPLSVVPESDVRGKVA